MGDQREFAIESANLQWLDHAVGASLTGIDIFHHHRRFLFERFLKLQWQWIFARGGRAQAHRAALLGDGIHQRDAQTAHAFHQAIEKQGGRLRIGQGAMGGNGLDP